jgi:hypothetical protein
MELGKASRKEDVCFSEMRAKHDGTVSINDG